jgi:hypothetical protein
MREIEQLILEWRKNLASRFGPERLEEIEEHLREAIEKGLAAGLGAREAFDAAVKRLGTPEAISAEFEKLRPAMWWPARLAIAATVLTAVLLPALLAFRFAGRPSDYLLSVHVFAITMGYLLTFLLGALGICYVSQRSLGELTPSLTQSLNRISFGFGMSALVLTAIGTILAMLWAQRAWGRAWAWDPKELGGLATLAWLTCVTISARRERTRTRAVMLMNVLGNIVVGIAWFGTAGYGRFGRLPASTGVPIFSILCGLIIVGSLAFFLLGLAPAGWLRRNRAY